MAKTSRRTEILADHFEKKQWGETKPTTPTIWPNNPIFETTADIRTDHFDDEELCAFLKKAKNNKSPGNDGIPMEFFKWLNWKARKEVLAIINQLWDNEWFLETMEEANVVTLYKKGNVEDPANYRPISLLQCLYKIYASIIQQRLSATVEEKVWKTQYGFRAKHSTTEALFVARRVQDFTKRTGRNFSCCLQTGKKLLIKWTKNCLYKLSGG